MPVEIVLATYNTMNLFESQHPRNGKPRRELQSLAYTIDGMRPDVLALQEVSSKAALKELNAGLKSPFPHLECVPGNSDRGIHLAFMSRFPFEVTSHARQVLTDAQGKTLQEYRDKAACEAQTLSPLRFQRDWLLAEFDLGAGTRLALFNAHLKSRSKNAWHLNPSEEIRLAEARAAARIVRNYQERHPQMPVVVAGDFNEVCEHPSLVPLLSLPGLSDPVRDDVISKNRLATTYWSKQRERIDYLLLNEPARRAYVPDSATIATHAGARKASDHLPVMLTLRF